MTTLGEYNMQKESDSNGNLPLPPELINTIVNIDHITLPTDFHKMTDFYIPENDPFETIIYPGALQASAHPEYNDIIVKMLEMAKQKSLLHKVEFSLNLEHDGARVIFRGHSIKTLESRIFIFRRLPSFIPKISSLGMPSNIIKLLTSQSLNSGGLVIIAGETGQGKSTTAGATIAHRLYEFGSFCLTIEDPMELPLQGFYENPDKNTRGVCFQTEVTEDTVKAAIKSALRCYPAISNSILFLGETRDSAMASEVLKIASNGHLVITTMHAMDLTNALMRFVSMAGGGDNGDNEEARHMLSSVFRLLIHQKLKRLPDNKRVIEPTILFSHNSRSNIAARIRDNKIQLLSTEIQNQNSQLAAGRSLV